VVSAADHPRSLTDALLLVKADVLHSSPILVTLMKEAPSSSEMSILNTSYTA
jgi:hypothetical protein